MKHLLEHLQMQIQKELDRMENASDVAGVNERLRYIYEDMLDKTERALEELSGEGVNFGGSLEFVDLGKHQTDSHVDSENEIEFENMGGGPELDGSNFEDLKKQLEFIGVDIEKLRETANVDDLEEEELTQVALDRVLQRVNSIEDVEPEVFRKIAQLSETKKFQEEMEEQSNSRLIEWAVGERDISFDKNEVANKIRGILEEAQKESDGTKGLLETFEDSIEELMVDVRRQPGVEPEVKTETEEDSENSFEETFQKQ